MGERVTIGLAACPFCGGPAYGELDDSHIRVEFGVFCDGLGPDCTASQTGFDTLAEAVVAWNRRAPKQGRSS